MIEWKRNDRNCKPAQNTHYLVTNGKWVTTAVLSELPNAPNEWTSENGYVADVTHYAEINLPEDIN